MVILSIQERTTEEALTVKQDLIIIFSVVKVERTFVL